jgi:hypothetical protein
MDELHGGHERGQTLRRVGLIVGDHLRFIDPGEWTEDRVLHEARRANGERRGCDLEDRGQLLLDLAGKLRLLEGAADLRVGRLRERQTLEPVPLDEGVEDARRDHGEGGDAGRDLRKA